MTKTATFTRVMRMAVPHFSLKIVDRCSAMIEIRLTIICIRSWTWNTQKNRMKKSTGTLYEVSQAEVTRDDRMSYVGPIIPSKNTHPMTVMIKLAAISPQSM